MVETQNKRQDRGLTPNHANNYFTCQKVYMLTIKKQRLSDWIKMQDLKQDIYKKHVK